MRAWPSVLVLSMALCVLPACPAQAGEAGLVRLDVQRSSGTFRVKIVWLLGIHGEFGHVDGQVRLDDFRNSLRVDAQIDAASLHMTSARLETWARSADFFDVRQFPQIVFASGEVARQRLRDGGELPGQLTVRGITRPVRFELLPADCARPAYDCPIRVNGSLRRSQFGMRSHRGVLADKVDLDFSIYLQSVPAGSVLVPG